MKPSAHILQALQRSKLLVRGAVASTGIGERKSRKVGSGMDFADFREYAPGDETRHLDARLYARFGSFYVRQYDVAMQLPITIVVDGSRSMLGGGGDKLTMALWLANVLGYTALRSSDQVQLAFWSGAGLDVSRRLAGTNKYRELSEWLERQQSEGTAPFETCFAGLGDALPERGLVILISDFWMGALEDNLGLLAAKGSELWAMQLLSRGEIDPTTMPEGEVTVTDAESGETVAIAIDQTALDGYQALLEEHQTALHHAFTALGGRHNLIATDADFEAFVLHEMGAAGMLSRV